ncbi:hypothetical protein [Streptomyces sp. CA-132043]|uniref:hypothetical protein n=1 Tax=Streptomyces sp. CA-132043 TaxID=3240048 RepID=UPI003D920890
MASSVAASGFGSVRLAGAAAVWFSSAVAAESAVRDATTPAMARTSTLPAATAPRTVTLLVWDVRM